MLRRPRNCPAGILLCIVLMTGTPCVAGIGYNRDVLPILARCFECHGVDGPARQAGLRLDRAGYATGPRDGRRAIVPGCPDESEVVRRIMSDDPDVVMPPHGHGQPLSRKEKETIRQWISEGAVYEEHWAFLLPRKAALPNHEWGHDEIDRFVFARLMANDLTPNDRAPKEQWLRRVTFDLTGLPPTIDEADAFLADESGEAFERVVDRLLGSPRYGERMAAWWLDGAHYGDSHGYDNDLENSQWPWRNWVINAFNDNMPFDQFTVEHLAGDLLPGARPNQVLATAFNRNHRIQTEGGAIDEEWRTEYVIDRVETLGAVWMGLTLNCCRCHDHKYDPITRREFYQLFSLFNQLDEKGFINNLRGAAQPRMRYRADGFQAEATAAKKIEDEDARKKTLAEIEKRFPFVMIMRDMDIPRRSFVLKRGQYDSPADEVVPGLPAVLPGIPVGEDVTRLSLARWLVNGRHPLTARVVVNRLWEQLFGTGIVRTSENLGIQAEWPSHPELLDWLAVDLAENGWDIKRLLRRIVLSATYRQTHVIGRRSGDVSTKFPEAYLKDPENRLLGRGPRNRLSAEMIRDQALALSGLLHEHVGGPSVRPYQPAGFWEEVEKRGTFVQDHGVSLYRRSLYTTIRKTVAPPDMVLFDMPSREV